MVGSTERAKKEKSTGDFHQTEQFISVLICIKLHFKKYWSLSLGSKKVNFD
jgi:hypothetical protein